MMLKLWILKAQMIPYFQRKKLFLIFSETYQECNSKLRIPTKLPIIFHNLEGYDGHIIFKELNNFDNIDIQVIPKASEKYMSIIIK